MKKSIKSGKKSGISKTKSPRRRKSGLKKAFGVAKQAYKDYQQHKLMSSVSSLMNDIGKRSMQVPRPVQSYGTQPRKSKKASE
jgi:hypothetical protein